MRKTGAARGAGRDNGMLCSHISRETQDLKRLGMSPVRKPTEKERFPSLFLALYHWSRKYNNQSTSMCVYISFNGSEFALLYKECKMYMWEVNLLSSC